MQHPSDDAIQTYAGDASDESIRYIQHHIIDCSECSRKVADCVKSAVSARRLPLPVGSVEV